MPAPFTCTQTVFELPRKMRAALDEDALDTAVGLYAEAQPLLHKYGGRGTFKVIALESDFVAQEISQVGGWVYQLGGDMLTRARHAAFARVAVVLTLYRSRLHPSMPPICTCTTSAAAKEAAYRAQGRRGAVRAAVAEAWGAGRYATGEHLKQRLQICDRAGREKVVYPSPPARCLHPFNLQPSRTSPSVNLQGLGAW